ncbi:hypothetical protein B566_EDAN009004 [Ephemera danica]|nr:hypothetical protein B566_EDAN009004 [Ephemera danica]
MAKLPIEVNIYEASEEEEDEIMTSPKLLMSSSYSTSSCTSQQHYTESNETFMTNNATMVQPSCSAPTSHFTPVTMSEIGREGRQWLTARSAKRIDCRSMESLRQQSSTTTSSVHLSTASSCSLRSMESLRSASIDQQQQQLLTTTRYCTNDTKYKSNSERDMRNILEDKYNKRRAVSGEELTPTTILNSSSSSTSTSFLNASFEPKTGGERRHIVPQHLSLPGSDQARRLTILSPHSPQPDMFHVTATMCTLKTRRKKAIVLPKLILPRSESDVFGAE